MIRLIALFSCQWPKPILLRNNCCLFNPKTLNRSVLFRQASIVDCDTSAILFSCCLLGTNDWMLLNFREPHINTSNDDSREPSIIMIFFVFVCALIYYTSVGGCAKKEIEAYRYDFGYHHVNVFVISSIITLHWWY